MDVAAHRADRAAAARARRHDLGVPGEPAARRPSRHRRRRSTRRPTPTPDPDADADARRRSPSTRSASSAWTATEAPADGARRRPRGSRLQSAATPHRRRTRSNTVYAVSPTGNVPPAQRAHADLLRRPVAPMPAPAGAPTIGGRPSVRPATPTQVTWAGYTCPSGTGSVSAYNVARQRHVRTIGQSTTSSVRTTARPTSSPATARVDVIVTYTVTCSGGTVGQRDSGASGQATVARSRPAPTATPTP